MCCFLMGRRPSSSTLCAVRVVFGGGVGVGWGWSVCVCGVFSLILIQQRSDGPDSFQHGGMGVMPHGVQPVWAEVPEIALGNPQQGLPEIHPQPHRIAVGLELQPAGQGVGQGPEQRHHCPAEHHSEEVQRQEGARGVLRGLKPKVQQEARPGGGEPPEGHEHHEEVGLGEQQQRPGVVQLGVPDLMGDHWDYSVHFPVQILEQGIVDDNALGPEHSAHVRVGVGRLARAVHLEDLLARQPRAYHQTVNRILDLPILQGGELVENRGNVHRVGHVEDQHKNGEEEPQVDPRPNSRGANHEHHRAKHSPL
eukprot:RCo002949